MHTPFHGRDHDHPTGQEMHTTQQTRSRRLREQGMVGIALVIVPVLMFLASSQLRHWIVELATAAAVLGGMIAAPLLALVGWIGLTMPAQVPLHRASTTLFSVAFVWLTVALVSAHWHSTHHRHSSERDG